jgi:hypothetical protein
MALTPEEKVAKKIVELVSHISLDLDMVSFYIASLSPNVAIKRILLMAEMANEIRNEGNNGFYDIR